MKIIPIITDIVQKNPKEKLEDWMLLNCQKNDVSLQEGDVIVLSSKIVSFFEGGVIDLQKITVAEDVKNSQMAKLYGAELSQLITEEADEMISLTPWVVLTIKNGIYCANAGIDQSNVPSGHVVVWPKDPFESALEIRAFLKDSLNLNKIAVLIVDSVCIPGRRGTVSVAIGTSGIKPYLSVQGEQDLFGRTFKYAGSNVVDGLATAANVTMGESTESCPMAIVRGFNWVSSEDTKNDEMIISPSEDMFPL